jgi:cysteine protease ATG4
MKAIDPADLVLGWRVPLDKPTTAPRTIAEVEELEAYAQYVRLMSWFLDDPSPLCPFSVHRMALIGKELGKEVGEWFGPSTAAGALK